MRRINKVIDDKIKPAIALPALSSFEIPIAPHIVPATANPGVMIIEKKIESKIENPIKLESRDRAKLTNPKTKAIIPSALPMFFTLHWFLSFFFLFN